MKNMLARGAQPRRRTVCLALASGVLAGCAGRTPVQSAPPLRVYGNLSTLELAPVLLAASRALPDPIRVQQGGISSLYGLDGDLPNLVARGESDLATNSETQALRYSVAHPDLRLILTVSEGLYRIVARRSAGIAQLADLRGKRVGTMPRTSSAYYLDRTLRSVGLTQSDVNVVPFVAGSAVPLSRMSEAFRRGELDAATIWEPELQRAQDALGADAIEFHDPLGYREQFSLFSTEAKLQDPSLRPRIVAYVRAIIDASAQIRRDPRSAWALVADATRQHPQIIERSWRHHSYPAALAPDLLDTMVQEEVWVAAETGRVPRGRRELASLIDASLLREALRAASPAADSGAWKAAIHSLTRSLRRS
ncbi:ABC transporter substrate-binding protein [Caenimonas terrae]|uniref:ABC transporter substrate-binding protein n=1 Tax=Caenimonas terrae TaxID=696074 RepID=A0ABW0NI94_9BURK